MWYTVCTLPEILSTSTANFYDHFDHHLQKSVRYVYVEYIESLKIIFYLNSV